VVFIVGMEEGILPHSRSYDDPEEMEEERRLCYVGITRAMERVYLVHTFRRTIYGENSPTTPSRFLREIPSYLLRPYSDDIDIEESKVAKPRPVQASFKPGEKVHHPKFGEGIVVDSVVKDGEEEVTVAFVGKGVKRLLVRDAKLEKV